MGEQEGNYVEEGCETHLNNVRAFWEVLDNIRNNEGKHDATNALAALGAALKLYYANASIRFIFD